MDDLLRFIKNEEGLTAMEYGLLIAVLGTATAVALTSLGNQLITVYGNASTDLR